MNKASTAIAAVAACTACCIPILWPMVAGIGTAGTLASLIAWFHRWPLDMMVCGGAALAFGGWVAWLYRRRSQALRCGCETVCQAPIEVS